MEISHSKFSNTKTWIKLDSTISIDEKLYPWNIDVERMIVKIK